MIHDKSARRDESGCATGSRIKKPGLSACDAWISLQIFDIFGFYPLC